MFDLQSYLSRLLSLLQQAFGSRLLYLGLQGSYLRGEANETSDIDVMAVIDRFNAVDLPLYRQALEQAGYFEKSCGFVCGAAELAAWNPLEICHLLHTTQDVYGALAPLVPSYTEQDQLNFIKLSLGNLLHLLTHNSLHADDSAAQADLLVQCSSVGNPSHPELRFESLDFVDCLPAHCVAADVNYPSNPFLERASARGLATVSGEGMLYCQQLAVMQLRFGVELPQDSLREGREAVAVALALRALR